jgi:hypothetical protein
MKMNRCKKQITPRTTRRLFLEPLEVRTMPSGLTVFGTDGSKHETTVKEESLGTFVQGISQNELIQVKSSGISGGASINWTLAYASGYGNNAALSPVTNISPSSGTLDVNHVRDDVTLTFNTSSLAVQTYHGELIASGGAGVSVGPYFFTFTVSAGTNPIITPPANQTATEGASTSFSLGSFTDPDGSPWTVDVNWGDGTAHTIFTTSSAGSLGSQSHTYAEEGNYTPTITVTDSSSRSDSKTFKVTVGDAALTSTGGFTVSATEGIVSASQTVATFNDANPTAPLSDFTAMINWGDGTVATAGTITQPGGVGTAFVVKGSHTYAEESASRTITVSITDVGGSTASASSTAVVADAAVTATGGFTVTGTEGSDTGSQTVATFTDTNPAAPLSDFTATINWGDGNTSAGAITQPGGIGTAFVVKGSHTYSEEGASYTISVNVKDVGGSTASATSTANIGDAGLSATGGLTVSATEGNTSATQTVATFTDANPAAPLSDFTATINWGDGNTSAGAISQPGGVGTAFVVKGSHTYAEEGASYTITVNITDVGGSTASTMSTGTVGDAALTATGGFTVTGTEGSDFGSQTVATFTDANPAAPLSDLTATIDWGDGTAATAGTISQPGGVGTAFVIKGSHTYVEEGASYTVTVDISDVGGSAASATSTASIADAALTASRTPVNAIEGLPFTGPVATFADANPFAPLGDFTATIDWGDGNSSAGTVTQPDGPGTDFVVTGTHTYAEEGSFNVTVAITDAGDSTASATSTASVTDATLTATGGFVVTATATGSHTVATFTDANPAAPLSDFTATINWGDGSAPTAGTLSQPGGAGTAFVIQGNHTYPAGSYLFTITANITDVGGSTASATSTASASFVVSGYPSPITAGTTNSFTVTAKDVNGNTATGYTGTVKFSSSAPKVILPANYTFTAGDAGVHNFSATLRSAGSQSITVTDTIIGTFSGTQSGITVNPTVPHHFSISRFPSPTTAGASFTFRVTVQDYYSNTVNTVPGFTDTVSFGSSDIQADLPANYTFKTADAGIHEFTGVLKTAGM